VNLDQLKAHLREAEGYRAKPYLDTVGVWTVGYGHALFNVTREQVAGLVCDRDAAEQLLDQDVAAAIHDAGTFPWWQTLDPVRQAVIVELCFNLGLPKLRLFERTLAAIQNREYQKASRMLLQSKWATQVGPRRSGRLATMLETGTV
jgi:lysozyme